MLEKLKARKQELEREYHAAEQAIADLQRRHDRLLETRLRISGALTLLDELIAGAQAPVVEEKEAEDA